MRAHGRVTRVCRKNATLRMPPKMKKTAMKAVANPNANPPVTKFRT
jgi:hypothetical protein